MSVDSVIFDLDGTLWDVSGTCATAWNHVVAENGIDFRNVTAADVASVMGKPHRDCIEAVYQGLTEKEIDFIYKETLVKDHRALAQSGGDLYEGVAQGLEKLAQHFPLYIVSNCQAGYIEAFLQQYGYGSLFKDFECWGNTGQAKSENLRAVMHRNDLSSTVYIGDTLGDMQAAQACAIPFIQVTYGFGAPIQGYLQASSFAELVDILLI